MSVPAWFTSTIPSRRLFCSHGVYDTERLGVPTVPHSISAKARRLATALLAFVGLGGASVWFTNKYFGIEAQALVARLWPPSTANQVEARQLHAIAGWFSIDCGHARHREDADHAIACAQDALKSRRRFYVAFIMSASIPMGLWDWRETQKGRFTRLGLTTLDVAHLEP
jgi:hypothetical protein